jgi:hypothetical protein
MLNSVTKQKYLKYKFKYLNLKKQIGAAAASDEDTINCTACTYQNSKHNKKCDICDTPFPKPKIADIKLDKANFEKNHIDKTQGEPNGHINTHTQNKIVLTVDGTAKLFLRLKDEIIEADKGKTYSCLYCPLIFKILDLKYESNYYSKWGFSDCKGMILRDEYLTVEEPVVVEKPAKVAKPNIEKINTKIEEIAKQVIQLPEFPKIIDILNGKCEPFIDPFQSSLMTSKPKSHKKP